MSEPFVELGDLVKDRVTGIEGIAVARTTHISGCDRITIQPQGAHEGKPIESYNYDEPNVLVLKKNALEELPSAKEPVGKRGGPPTLARR